MAVRVDFTNYTRTWKETLFKPEVTFENFNERLRMAEQKLETCMGPPHYSHIIGEEQIFSEQPFYDITLCCILEKKWYDDIYVHNVVIFLQNKSSKLTNGVKYSLGVYQETDLITWFSRDEHLVPGNETERVRMCSSNYYNMPRVMENDSLTVVIHFTIDKDENRSTILDSPDLSAMIGDIQLADVTLKCGNYERKFHRFVLALKSDVFKAMLTEDGFTKEDPIEIKDTDPTILDAFINCLYKFEESIVEENAFEILQLADRYNVKNLFLQCSNVLQMSLTEEIVVQCLVLAYFHNDICLEAKCSEIIQANFATIKTSEEWKWLMADHPNVLNRLFEKAVILSH